jgi:hypothetical protein
MALFSATGGASIVGLRKRAAISGGNARLCLVAAAAVVFVAGLATAASAQQYQADPINEALGKQGASIQAMAKDPAKYTAGQQQFDEYFTGYYFPAMTRHSEEDLAKLGALRYDLFNRILWATQNEDLQSHLSKLAFDGMKSIAVKPIYHPAVRYNAILVIGMLDDKYGIDTASNKRPPKPQEEANKFLLQVIDAAVKGKAVPPSLVVGALVGLERHAQYHDGLSSNQIQAMTDMAIALATKNPPLPDVDSKVAEWIRIQAATVLAKLGSVGLDGHALDALVNVLADNKLTLDGRCEVAGLLGQINFKDAKVDGKATTDKVLQLAVEVAQAQDKVAKDFQEQSLTGGGAIMSRSERGGGRMSGGYGGYGASSVHSEFDRKTLLSRLADLRKGIAAIKPMAPTDRAAAIDPILSSLQTVIDAASSKDKTDLDLADAVRKMSTAVQGAVKGGTATAAAKPAADAF